MTIRQKLNNTKLGQWYSRNFDNRYLPVQIFYIVGMFVFPTVIGFGLMKAGLFEDYFTMIFTGPYILLLLGAIWMMRKDLKKDFSNKFDRKFWTTVFILFCVLFFVNEFGSQVISSLITKLNVPSGTGENQELFEALMKIASGSMGATALIGAVLEEIVFRKALMSYIKNRKAAVIVSTLTFACMHVTSFALSELIMLVLYITLGFAFSMIYEKTKDIRYSMFVHFLNNLVGVIQTML